MGDNEWSRISGTLPATTVTTIDFPGYVINTGNALASLGGMSAVEQALNSDSSFLELRYRPLDPLSHPLYGDQQNCNNLLLKITKRRLKKNLNVESPSAEGSQSIGEWKITSEIIARIERTFSFEGRADFQHVIGWAHDKARNEAQFSKLEEEPLLIVPPLFSKHDLPDDQFIHSMEKEERLKMDESGPPSHEAEKDNTILEPDLPIPLQPGLDFNASQVPQPLSTADVLSASDQPLVEKIQDLFQGRPIWSIHSLAAAISSSMPKIARYPIKRTLPYVAYTFTNGPFRTLWILRGYDPRTDPTSRIYQMVDFRIPLTWGVMTAEGKKDSSLTAWPDTCAFKCLPDRQSPIFQFCDLQDGELQDILKQPLENETCSETSGWYSRDSLEKMRDRIRIRFHALLPTPGLVPLMFPRVRDPRQGFIRNTKVLPPGTSQLTESRKERLGSVMGGQPIDSQTPSADPNPTFNNDAGIEAMWEAERGDNDEFGEDGGYGGQGEEEEAEGAMEEGEDDDEDEDEEEEEEEEFELEDHGSDKFGDFLSSLQDIPTQSFLELMTNFPLKTGKGAGSTTIHPLVEPSGGGDTYDIYENDDDDDDDS